MQLIVQFRGYDGRIAEEFLDQQEVDFVSWDAGGTRLRLWSGGNIVATADLRVTGKQALWHLRKGQRGRDLGTATEVVVGL